MFFVWDLNLSAQQAKIIDKLSLVQDNLTATRQVVLTSEVSNTILPPQIVLEKRPSQHHVRQNSLSIVSHRQKLFFWRPLSLGKPSVIDYTSLSTHRGFVNCEAPWRWWVVPSLWPDLGHCSLHLLLLIPDYSAPGLWSSENTEWLSTAVCHTI